MATSSNNDEGSLTDILVYWCSKLVELIFQCLKYLFGLIFLSDGTQKEKEEVPKVKEEVPQVKKEVSQVKEDLPPLYEEVPQTKKELPQVYLRGEAEQKDAPVVREVRPKKQVSTKALKNDDENAMTVFEDILVKKNPAISHKSHTKKKSPAKPKKK